MHGVMATVFELVLGLLLASVVTNTYCLAASHHDTSSHDSQAVVTLTPDHPLFGVSSPIPASHVYRLEGLLPDTPYEVRISHPATMPARFLLEFISPITQNEDSSIPNTRSPTERRLLDTDKIMFRTNAQGRVQVGSATLQSPFSLKVTVLRYAVSWKEGFHERPVVFDIVLETLVLGGIPREVLKIAALVAVALFVFGMCVFRRLVKELNMTRGQSSRSD